MTNTLEGQYKGGGMDLGSEFRGLMIPCYGKAEYHEEESGGGFGEMAQWLRVPTTLAKCNGL